MADDATRDALRRQLLGWSVACPLIEPGDIGRDIALAADPATGLVDLARVEQVDALGQSLSLALTTALGSDVFDTQFGFDGIRAIAEEISPAIARERIRIAVVQVLRRDPRVRRIDDVELGDDFAPGRGILNVSVAFQTAAGDDARATLGEVSGLG